MRLGPPPSLLHSKSVNGGGEIFRNIDFEFSLVTRSVLPPPEIVFVGGKTFSFRPVIAAFPKFLFFPLNFCSLLCILRPLL